MGGLDAGAGEQVKPGSWKLLRKFPVPGGVATSNPEASAQASEGIGSFRG